MKESSTKAFLKVCLIFLIIAFQFLLVSSQELKSDSLAAEKIKEIQNLAYKDRLNAQRWWYTWLTAYSAATIGQGIITFTAEDIKTKQDMAVGSVSSLLGALGLLITPIVPPNSSIKNPMLIDNSLPENEETIENYEEILKEIARRETAGRSWKMHALTGCVNLGCGLVTWLGFNRPIQDGIVVFALNTVVTEAQIWSQPIRAKKDYQNYCEKYYPGITQENIKSPMEWTVNVYPAGLTFEINF